MASRSSGRNDLSGQIGQVIPIREKRREKGFLPEIDDFHADSLGL